MDRAEHDPKLHQADPEAEVGGADGALVLDPEPRRTGLRRKLVQSLIVVAQRFLERRSPKAEPMHNDQHAARD
jgi:hypothetical protein